MSSLSQGRSELFVFIGVAFATAFGLLVLQKGYESYIDASYHAKLAQLPANEAILALRQTESDKLQSGGKISIDRAKAALAEKGRNGFGVIAPVQSEDLSAVSGWIKAHDFKAAVAHPIRTPRAPVVEPAPVAEPVVAPEPETPAPAAKKPARKAAAPSAAPAGAAPAAQ